MELSERGRLARNEREARTIITNIAPAARCGRDARDPIRLSLALF